MSTAAVLAGVLSACGGGGGAAPAAPHPAATPPTVQVSVAAAAAVATSDSSTWTDWTWFYNGVPFTYSDGTIVGQEPRQSVTFVGLRYVYRWP